MRTAAIGFGMAFGFWLDWAGFTRYETIMNALLLRDAYLWLMFGTAVSVGFLGLRALRASGLRTIADRKPITWEHHRPTRATAIGAAIFGVGWAVSGTCPAPAIAQVGSGRLAGIFTSLGIVAGIALADAWESRRARRKA